MGASIGGSGDFVVGGFGEWGVERGVGEEGFWLVLWRIGVEKDINIVRK